MRLVRCLTAASLQLKTASGHSMQYYVALPAHWTPDRQWPIVAVDAKKLAQDHGYANLSETIVPGECLSCMGPR
jgi:hypothetical protein